MRKAAIFIMSIVAVIGLTATAAGAAASPHTGDEEKIGQEETL